MLDMGFIHDVNKILARLPKKRQSLLFSATYAPEVRKFAERLLNDPAVVEAAPRNSAAPTVSQTVYRVERSRKTALLVELIQRNGWEQVLVFARTKHGVNRLTRHLDRADLCAAAIHGNKSQNARVNALTGFKDRTVRILVATDIAARGLDINGLPQVVNFDLPQVPEDYVHRIGRTGRAGATGRAVSLVSECENDLLRGVERLLDTRLPTVELQGFTTSVAPQAEQTSSRVRGSSRPNRPNPRRENREGKTMATGTVKWFNATKGYGFIEPSDKSKDVFVHISAVEAAGLRALADGQAVEYELGEGRDGRSSAESLKLID
jgi:ATP-dependent RNA helicase RhlE